MTRVLVVGVPRSGTTWVSNVLARTPGSAYLGEPDNHFYYPFAYRAKLKLQTRQYPCLSVDDEAPELDELWRAALSETSRRPTLVGRARRSASMHLLAGAGVPRITAVLDRRRQPDVRLRLADALAVAQQPESRGEHLIVQSVYTLLALDWLVARYATTVVVVLREPLNILSSWIELGWLGGPGSDMLDTLDPNAAERLAADSGVEGSAASAGAVLSRAAWLLGLLLSALRRTVERHPEWHVVAHEDLCRSPNARFSALVDTLGLTWDPGVDRLLEETNRPGRGYETSRVRATLPDAWRSRLSPEDTTEILDVLSKFPITDWTHWRAAHSAASD
jgi:hypothetical protein